MQHGVTIELTSNSRNSPTKNFKNANIVECTGQILERYFHAKWSAELHSLVLTFAAKTRLDTYTWADHPLFISKKGVSLG